MDGKYPSNSYSFTEDHKALIKKWIQEAIINKGWEEHLDLHVDEICKDGKYNKRGKHKKYWIPISISLAYYANKLLQEITKVDIIGVVDIPLYANERTKMDFPFQKLENMRSEFDLTPPSLSVYPKECTELADIYQDTKKLGSIFIDDSQFDVLAYEFFLKKDCIQHMRVISLLPPLS